MSSKSKMPNQKQSHPTMTFQDMVGDRLLKSAIPMLDQKIQQAAFEVQKRLAQQQLAFQASITTDLAALKAEIIEAGITTEKKHREKVWELEDGALGCEQVSDGSLSQAGDRIRGKLSFTDKGGDHEQPVLIGHLAQDPRVLMGSLEEYLIGHVAGETVELPSPAEGVSGVKVEILRLSRMIPPPQAPEAPAPEAPAAEESAPAEAPAAEAPAQAEGSSDGDSQVS